MQIITGYTGESHVTSADDASLYRGIFGAGDYVLDIGNKFAATIIDNNTIRIADGDLIIQGHQARIRANDYEEVTIDNGTPGLKRNDLIVARYKKNTTTGIESISLEVVKGTPGITAVDPDIVQEDLPSGGAQRDFPLYRVTLNGLILESITSLFTVLPNLNVLKSHLEESAIWKRIDTLSAPVQLTTGSTYDNPIIVPVNETPASSNVYAVEFRIQSPDNRASQIAIFAGGTSSATGIFCGVDHEGNIYAARRSIDAANRQFKFYALISPTGGTREVYISRIFRVK